MKYTAYENNFPIDLSKLMLYAYNHVANTYINNHTIDLQKKKKSCIFCKQLNYICEKTNYYKIGSAYF